MTAATTAALPHRPDPDEEAADRVWSAIDQGFLSLVRWNPDVRVLTFPVSDPLLGITVCVVAGCEQVRSKATGLCPTCDARWQQADRPPLPEFTATPRIYGRTNDISGCAVPECRRPQRSSTVGLCNAHQLQRKYLGLLPLEDFFAHPHVVALPSYGPCAVAACSRDRAGRGTYCALHQGRWRRHRAQHPDGDEQGWRRTEPAAIDRGQVSLRGLAPRLVAEVIYGLQERTRLGFKTPAHRLRPLCTAALTQQAGCLDDIAVTGFAIATVSLHKSLSALVRRQGLSPDTERIEDEWDTTVFGQSGILRFTGLTQPWLRQAAKKWANDDLPKRRGTDVRQKIQNQINSLGLFSDSIRLQRDDHGDHPAVLSRQDITAFCNRLAYLQDQGTISADKRLRTCRDVRRVLTRMRGLGLTRADEPLEGLPDDVALGYEDIPDEPEDAETGRDLPTEVMRHLCEHLSLLDEVSVELRVAVELLIDTGRRPNEVCQLGWDCLERDADGKPVLVYDNHKNNRPQRRQPIPEATASLIITQQQRVRERFPDTPAAELKLLPAPLHNPHGSKGVSKGWISGRHRRWVDQLPPTLVPMSVIEDGKHVTKSLPFDPTRIYLYAYRHTYAQRHADAGVAVDVLRELMDHRQLSTSQQYYRVGEQRRRDAVERVTTMQFDRHGNRIWRQAQALLESEHLRRAVGEVAVPYGGCTEPSNVAAGGQDCPVRFRCVGCGHFSTDISYLPDLERYLADLLRHRERLAATVRADEWAKSEAMPSDDEITRVRRLIDRMKGDLDDLSEEDRSQITDAITLVRRGRGTITGLGIPRVRQPLPDTRPERTA